MAEQVQIMLLDTIWTVVHISIGDYGSYQELVRCSPETRSRNVDLPRSGDYCVNSETLDLHRSSWLRVKC